MVCDCIFGWNVFFVFSSFFCVVISGFGSFYGCWDIFFDCVSDCYFC